MIEQKELYANIDESDQNGGIHADSRFNIPSKPAIAKAEDIVQNIQDTNVSPAVRDVILHGREEALRSLPMNIDRLAKWEEVVDAVVEYEVSQGLPPNYTSPYPEPPSQLKPLSSSTSSISSPLSSTHSPLSSMSPASSIHPPLSHNTSDNTSPFSTPEPNMEACDSRTTPPNQSPESMTSFDSYVPHSTLESGMGMSLHHPTTDGLGTGPIAPPTGHTQLHTFSDPVKAGLGTPLQANQILTPQLIKGVGSSMQFNEAGAIANQYNGNGAIAQQFNGPNTIASQYNTQGVTAHQYNNYSNTLATQHNGPHVSAAQFNGAGVIASQYNNGHGCVASQFNEHNLLASQVNGPNAVGRQYNGPNVSATQFNGSNGAQCNNGGHIAPAQGYQYGTDTTKIPPQSHNGVNVVANQYIGVQPQPQYGGGAPFNAHQPQYTGQAPVINMNVTINIPQSTGVPLPVNYTDQKPVSSCKLSHFPNEVPAAPFAGHVGKVEPNMSSSCNPYNVHGTFEVSQQTWPNGGAGFKMLNDTDDILEALQLM